MEKLFCQTAYKPGSVRKQAYLVIIYLGLELPITSLRPTIIAPRNVGIKPSKLDLILFHLVLLQRRFAMPDLLPNQR